MCLSTLHIRAKSVFLPCRCHEKRELRSVSDSPFRNRRSRPWSASAERSSTTSLLAGRGRLVPPYEQVFIQGGESPHGLGSRPPWRSCPDCVSDYSQVAIDEIDCSRGMVGHHGETAAVGDERSSSEGMTVATAAERAASPPGVKRNGLGESEQHPPSGGFDFPVGSDTYRVYRFEVSNASV